MGHDKIGKTKGFTQQCMTQKYKCMYFALLWSAQNKGKINPCLPQNAGRTEGRVDSLSGHELFFTDITTLPSFSLGLGHFEDGTRLPYSFENILLQTRPLINLYVLLECWPW